MLLFCLPDYAHMLLSVLVNGSPGTHNMHILVHAHLQVQLTCIWVLLFFFFFFQYWIIVSPVLHLGPQDAIIRRSHHVPYVSYLFAFSFTTTWLFICLPYWVLLVSFGDLLSFTQLQEPLASQERFLPHVLQSLVCYLRKGLQGAQESAHVQK